MVGLKDSSKTLIKDIGVGKQQLVEIANFNYPTAITNLRLNRYSGIKAEVEKSETHGWTPITMSVTFNLTTYTSKKVGK